MSKKPIDWDTAITRALVVIAVVGPLGVTLGVRLWLAGGDWGCVAASDPALCAAVSGAGR